MKQESRFMIEQRDGRENLQLCAYSARASSASVWLVTRIAERVKPHHSVILPPITGRVYVPIATESAAS